MKSHRFTQVLTFVLFACVVALAGVSSNKKSRTQDKSKEQASATTSVYGKTSDAVKPAPGADIKAGLATKSSAMFEDAAARNAQLQNSMEWSFGNKLQRGWSLYVPMAANLIGSDFNAAAGSFASRLSLWQKENSIEPTGVLDGVTWSRMISTFQSRRLSNRAHTTPNELITIPISDCYDPTRAEELRKAEPETFAAYKRMVAAAIADRSLGLQASSEPFLKIISAFRSREYQDQLRRQSPNSGRAGLAINSPHATGRALDLFVGGEPVSTKDENRAIQTGTPVYRWLVQNAGRFGFRPYFYEPWHWEYVGVGADDAK
jgi:zinc D-Ala-D-Ala carboxypeptidase